MVTDVKCHALYIMYDIITHNTTHVEVITTANKKL